MRVLLIAGGWSNEREVSLNGAVQIEKSLKDMGHEVIFFDLEPDLDALIKLARNSDAAMINLHGCPGEDGTLQALLDDLGVPYQGSGPLGSFLAINKSLTKQILRNHGLPTPDWVLLPGYGHRIPPGLKYPLVAKPNTGGSSLNMAIIENPDQLLLYLEQFSSKHQEIILEDYVQGLELTCAVLDQDALPPVLIKPLKGSFFDYDSKYDPDGATEICPAPVPQKTIRMVQEMALEVHKILGLKHYSRTDFMMDKEGSVYILEANTLPGMTLTSLVPRAAMAAGLDFTDLVGKLLSLALDPGKRTRRRI